MGGPYEGLRVVDFGRYIAGPYCAALLGDLGAEVIKIELPDEGDPTTNPAPPRSDPIAGQRPDPFGQAQPGALPDPYAKPQ